MFEDSLEQAYWSSIWQRLVDHGEPDSWAYRWTFTCLVNSGLTALPNKNLVRNVGFGPSATHTSWPCEEKMTVEGLGNLEEPSFLVRDTAADSYTFEYAFGGRHLRNGSKPIPRLKAFLKRKIRILIG